MCCKKGSFALSEISLQKMASRFVRGVPSPPDAPTASILDLRSLSVRRFLNRVMPAFEQLHIIVDTDVEKCRNLTDRSRYMRNTTRLINGNGPIKNVLG